MQAPVASTLVIFGAGGHGRVVADAALAAGTWGRIVATDRDPVRCRGELLPGVALLPLEDALTLTGAVYHVAIGVAAHRERETQPLIDRLATVVHPDASVSPWARLSAGCFVAAQAVVAPGAQLGAGVIVNHGAVVDHDAQVGAFSHVAPQAALGGHSQVGARVLVGSGARLLPSVQVCDGCTLGAGAVVLASIQQPGTWAGVPAARLG